MRTGVVVAASSPQRIGAARLKIHGPFVEDSRISVRFRVWDLRFEVSLPLSVTSAPSCLALQQPQHGATILK